MSKHDIDTKQNQPHVAMKQIGNLVFAARVHQSGAWVMAQGMLEDKLRRTNSKEGNK